MTTTPQGADHDKALETSNRLDNTYADLENLKLAYLERDRQYKELRELADRYMRADYSVGEALRAAIGDKS